MKILYVGHTYTIRANQAKIAALAKTSSSFGSVEITLVTPHAWRGPLYSNNADRFNDSLAANVEHRIIRAWGVGKESAFLYAPSIVPLVSRIKPDIVHVEQGAYAISYAQILSALKLFSPGSRAVFFTWWNLPYQPRGIRRLLERFNLSHSSSAVAGNEAAREILRGHGFNGRIEVLPQLGINVSSDRTVREKKDSAQFTIGYAGRIAEEKGVLDLVYAAGKMREAARVQLYFVGTGEALNAVKIAAAVQNIQLIHHGAVRNEELANHLAKMDVLVLPSRTTPTWVEQFGHILLEAMAIGVPVIGSSSGEISNVISNAGLIFKEGNISQLTSGLERLFEDPEERKRLSVAGKKRVSEHFTHERIAAAQMRLYEWMMLDGRPVGSHRRLATVEERAVTTAL